MNNSVDWKEELRSSHSSVGVMLNSILGFPDKGETAGSMKEKILNVIIPFMETVIDAMPRPKNPECEFCCLSNEDRYKVVSVIRKIHNSYKNEAN